MNISESVISRKGARSPKEVPADVLSLLNSGAIECVNLSEWLAIDQKHLLKSVFKDMGFASLIPEFIETMDGLKKQTATQLIKAIGQLLLDSEQVDDSVQLRNDLASHKSDTVRCWAAYATGLDEDLSLEEKFDAISHFAADNHFGVREIAWLAMRNDVIGALDDALEILTEWSRSPDANIRRFASEATRPRGVWCPHIDALKDDPSPALPILEPLKSDPAKYVRDSVGNWLNDASKTCPEWVLAVCDRWTKESGSNETAYIVKKARRTIDKKK